MVGDVLLQDVRRAFASLAEYHLRPFLRALQVEKAASPHVQESIVRQLLRLQWRSQDVLSEFAEFHCVRLLLDEQSPLATYFIDLFCQLECLLQELSVAYCLMEPLQHIDEKAVLPLLRLMRPVASTCRLLYVVYMILPNRETKAGWEEQNKVWRDEVKLSGRHGRRFLGNEMHCRIREVGLTNLDQPGISMIRLTDILGEGAFAKVYKGVFEADDGKSKKIIGRPVAVKMFKRATSNVGSSSNVDWGTGSSSNADGGTGSSSTGSSSNADWASCDARGSNSNVDVSSCTVDGGGSNFYFGIQLSQSMDQQPGKLRQELHKLVSVKHPNIVTPTGYIGKRPDQGDGGLAMELMDGSLHDYLEEVKNKRIPPLKELDMLDLMLEIAKGMRFLHECDIIHRDLKPQNVLLRFCADGEDLAGCPLFEVKLGDFGLTKLLYGHFDEGGTVSRHTTFQGTSCYMAPEIRGNSKDEEIPFPEKVDVFSFGTTCFNILIGNPDPCAFSHTSGAFYEAVRTGKWKEWMQGRCIDEQLHYLIKLIGKCWETDPAMRPTFAALCLLLQHAMQCLLSAQSLRNALGAAQAISAASTMSMSKLQEFNQNSIIEDAVFYSPLILEYLVQGQDSVIGLKEGTTWLHNFRSFIGRIPNQVGHKILDMVSLIQQLEPQEVFQDEGDGRSGLLEGRTWLHNFRSCIGRLPSCKILENLKWKIFKRKILKRKVLKTIRAEERKRDMIRESIGLEIQYYKIDDKMKKIFLAIGLVEAIKQILLRGLVCNAYDAAERPDINSDNLMKAVQESFRNAPLLTSTCELMESCLEKPDPLIFMKGLPCHNLAERYSLDVSYDISYRSSIGYLPLQFELPPSYQNLDERYDFTGDEARSELAVDRSLIPLLVSFWANPYLPKDLYQDREKPFFRTLKLKGNP